jgi:hypothetical protein
MKGDRVEERKVVQLHYEKEHADAFLGSALIAYREALNLAFKELARIKGTEDLTWFDELRAQAVRASKGTVTEQIPIETEAKALRFGFQALDLELEALRRRLVKPE